MKQITIESKSILSGTFFIKLKIVKLFAILNKNCTVYYIYLKIQNYLHLAMYYVCIILYNI